MYARSGNAKDATIELNEITFLGVPTACSHARLIEDVLR